jgi:hypothetical protein
MNRPTRYVLSLLGAGVIAGALYTQGYHSLPLLAGIFVIFSVSGVLSLRYPAFWGRQDIPNIASGVFTGGATLGAFVLALETGTGFNYAAGLFGIGLVTFGAACGYWMAETYESP